MTAIDRKEFSQKQFFDGAVIEDGLRNVCFEKPFLNHILDDSKRMRSSGNIRTAETYMSAFRSFDKFLCGISLSLAEIDQKVISDYEMWLKRGGVRMNTISFYMRILRAVYNRAVGDEWNGNPFKDVYTGIAKTEKRAVALSVIRKIKELDLSADRRLEYVRDLFMFSFYTRGMSFVDMAYLRKSDCRDGILSYSRKKTGTRLSIRMERCINDIAERYAISMSPYLLPIIQNPGENERQQYISAAHYANRRLKEIGSMIGLETRLTMYVARHSWASIAYRKNIPVSVISEGMGHGSETVTRVYLSSLDTSVVDRANELIINSL